MRCCTVLLINIQERWRNFIIVVFDCHTLNLYFIKEKILIVKTQCYFFLCLRILFKLTHCYSHIMTFDISMIWYCLNFLWYDIVFSVVCYGEYIKSVVWYTAVSNGTCYMNTHTYIFTVFFFKNLYFCKFLPFNERLNYIIELNNIIDYI